MNTPAATSRNAFVTAVRRPCHTREWTDTSAIRPTYQLSSAAIGANTISLSHAVPPAPATSVGATPGNVGTVTRSCTTFSGVLLAPARRRIVDIYLSPRAMRKLLGVLHDSGGKDHALARDNGAVGGHRSILQMRRCAGR